MDELSPERSLTKYKAILKEAAKVVTKRLHISAPHSPEMQNRIFGAIGNCVLGQDISSALSLINRSQLAQKHLQVHEDDVIMMEFYFFHGFQSIFSCHRRTT